MNIEKLFLEYLYSNNLNYDDFWVPLKPFFDLNPSIEEKDPELSFCIKELEDKKYISVRSIGNNEKSIFLYLEGIIYYEDTYFLSRKERPIKRLIEKILKVIEKMEIGRIKREYYIRDFLEMLNLEINRENRVKIYLLNNLISGIFVEHNSVGYTSSKDPEKKEMGIISFRKEPPHLITRKGKDFLNSLRFPKLFPTGTWLGKSGILHEDFTRIIEYFEFYAKIQYRLALEKEIHFRLLSIFKPANYLIVIDDKNLILFESQKNVMLGMPAYTSWDFRGKEAHDFGYYASIALTKLGFEEIWFFPLPSELLKMPPKEAKKVIEKLAIRFFNKEYDEIMKGDKAERLQKEKIFLFYDNASEDDFTQLFFAPLAKSMGFENVKVKGHRIKTLEYGQDIKLMKLRLPTGHFLIFVAQVKKGDITSSSKEPDKEIEKLLTEIRPAFNKKVFDDEIGRSIKPHHVFLVSSGIINEYARVYLEEQLEDEYKGQLLLLDRDKLYDLYVKYGLSKPEQAALTDYLKKIKERKEALEESKNVDKKVLIEDFLSKLSSFEGLMGLLLNEEVWAHDKYTKDINGTFSYITDLGWLNELEHQEFNDLKNRQKLAYLKGKVPSMVQIKQDIALIESLKSRVEEEIHNRALYEDSLQ